MPTENYTLIFSGIPTEEQMDRYDYVWNNFGSYKVSNTLEKNPLKYIPTQQLVVDLIKNANRDSLEDINKQIQILSNTLNWKFL